MTSAAKTETGDEVRPPDMVTLTIDGAEISVPKGTLVIRAAELMGIQIPRFCDHPLLDPVGACRQCMVEVEGQRKPMASCTIVCTDDMVVRTQLSSEAADKAQHGVMELLLINHPLDCPMCDKGGECPLQNQAMSNGRADSRFEDVKRTFAKPINISSQVLLDRERCILCARCTRFSEQIAGDPFIDMQERGALQQVGIYANEPFESYFSGNTVQICPVGALTGTAYRFRARPFDLVSSPSVCEHCAGGCAERTDHRRGKVLRRLAGDDPEVNEEWNCDKGRWAFRYTTQPDVLTTPLIRDADGELVPASWSHAIATAVAGLEAARGRTGVLVGGRVTWEDAYAYSKFARIALDTNDIDFRARPHSAEEADFLAARVAGRPLTVSYSDLESAPVVLLVGFEPEEEAPIVFLRLRKAARKHSVAGVLDRAVRHPRAGQDVRAVDPDRLRVPKPSALDGLATGEVAEMLSAPGAVIMVGERLATVPGGLSAAARLADATGARLAWVPRRAGERGALEAGALPGLLPGGRPVADDAARAQVAAAWNVDELPTTPGRDVDGILAAATDGTLGALLVGGIEPADFPDPDAVLAALDAANFVISLELRHSEVTERADVVFPVASTTQKAGAFINWEGRFRPFQAALHGCTQQPVQSDHLVLDALADEMGVDLGMPSVEPAARGNVRAGHLGRRVRAGPHGGGRRARPTRGCRSGAGRLADAARQRAPAGRRTASGRNRAHPIVARLSADTATEIGAADGDAVTVSTSQRLNHPAVGHHRHARPGGVAAAELAGIGGAAPAGRRRPAAS